MTTNWLQYAGHLSDQITEATFKLNSCLEPLATLPGQIADLDADRKAEEGFNILRETAKTGMVNGSNQKMRDLQAVEVVEGMKESPTEYAYYAEVLKTLKARRAELLATTLEADRVRNRLSAYRQQVRLVGSVLQMTLEKPVVVDVGGVQIQRDG